MDNEEKAKKRVNDILKETSKENQNVQTGGDWIGSGGKSSVASPSTNKSTLDYGTYKDDLDRLTEAQKKYQVAQLKSARDKALANLDVQEQSIKPTYQNARNMSSATSQQNARSFAEYMANRGLTNSGAAAQAEINRQSALQNSLGNINTAEANAFRDIANQRTQVNNDYVNGVATANAAIQQQYLNNLLNYNEQQRQYVNNLRNQALGQYAGDYQAYMNTLNPNSLEYLEVAARRGNKVANNYSNAYTYNNSMNNILNGTWSANDLIATGRTQEQAQRLFEDNQAKLQAQAQIEAEQRAWNRYEAQTKLDNDTMKARAQVANVNSQIANRGSSTNKNQVINNATQRKIIEHNFITKDEFGDTIEDQQGIANYITSELYDGTMSEIDAKSFAKEYGLNYYQLTPEYQIIFNDMEMTSTRQKGLEVLEAYAKANPSLDNGIIRQLEQDWNSSY